MLVERSGPSRAYVLTVAPLHVDIAAAGRRLAMIVVVDPERHAPSGPDLAVFFGLSPAEARLAAALLRGQKLPEIADSFAVRVTTLRTQLASILRKVGVSRQLDLVRLLSGIGISSAGWLGLAESLAEAAP